ncbi:MAG: TetR/AcrR family transcriptional regulator C-terminal domain-containing protein [Clostridiales bacterium]|nr:TetR/AcrR family transcriptional regulator C-terminal domain-containing protein [Clostridiales bacterium]
MPYAGEAKKNEPTTRMRIKSRFLDEYRKKPLRQIHVDDLAKACSISRGTFYFYFESIPFLYRECEKEIILLMEAYVPDMRLNTVGNDIDNSINTAVLLLRVIKEHLVDYKSFVTGSERDSFLNAWSEHIYAGFAPTMDFSRNTPLRTRENISRFYAGGLVSVLKNWILSDCDEPEESLAAMMAQVIFRGLYSRQEL